MLTAHDARRDTGRRRAEPSQKQRYYEYVLQRIEAFKNSISREELLRMADQAAAETCRDDDQFVLTEMVMADEVDRLIFKRLKIKKFRRWQQQYATLRAAQREPTHWGLDRTCPVAQLVGRIEPGDRTLVIGSGAETRAYLLAAHDADIRFWDKDFGVVQRVEKRAGVENLAMQFFAYCQPLDLPPLPSHGAPYDILVLDAGALADADARHHPDIIAQLQDLTAEGGVHVLLPSPRLVPEAVFSFYAGWQRETPAGARRSTKSRGAVLVKPVAEEMRQAERA